MGSEVIRSIGEHNKPDNGRLLGIALRETELQWDKVVVSLLIVSLSVFVEAAAQSYKLIVLQFVLWAGGG